MPVMDTSIESYYSETPDKEVQKQIVFNAIKRTFHPSSRDIADATRLPRTSVTGRLRELEQDGTIFKADKKKDEITNKTVYWYAITEGVSE